jgi:hypothetical protein
MSWLFICHYRPHEKSITVYNAMHLFFLFDQSSRRSASLRASVLFVLIQKEPKRSRAKYAPTHGPSRPRIWLWPARKFKCRVNLTFRAATEFYPHMLCQAEDKIRLLGDS